MALSRHSLCNQCRCKKLNAITKLNTERAFASTMPFIMTGFANRQNISASCRIHITPSLIRRRVRRIQVEEKSNSDMREWETLELTRKKKEVVMATPPPNACHCPYSRQPLLLQPDRYTTQLLPLTFGLLSGLYDGFAGPFLRRLITGVHIGRSLSEFGSV